MSKEKEFVEEMRKAHAAFDGATMCLSSVSDFDLINRISDMMRDVRILIRTHQPVIIPHEDSHA